MDEMEENKTLSDAKERGGEGKEVNETEPKDEIQIERLTAQKEKAITRFEAMEELFNDAVRYLEQVVAEKRLFTFVCDLEDYTDLRHENTNAIHACKILAKSYRIMENLFSKFKEYLKLCFF